MSSYLLGTTLRNTQTTTWIKHTALGVGLLLGSSLLAPAALFFGLLALFFWLAELSHLVEPALIASAITAVFVLLGFFAGLQRLRRS